MVGGEPGHLREPAGEQRGGEVLPESAAGERRPHQLARGEEPLDEAPLPERDPELPEGFELSAESNGTVMGIRHRELPAEGVQFHPESILTPSGKRILDNFLALRITV